MTNKTLVVNLFGAPGAGKSTGAAYIFSKLKLMGINCELVTEYAKKKVWEENSMVFNDQLYILGKQHYAQLCLNNKVDVIITDSPLLLSIYYNNDPILGENFNQVTIDVFDSFNNMNFDLVRVKPYNPSGRYQDEAGSDEVAIGIRALLKENGYAYKSIRGDELGYDYIINEILMELNK